MRNTTWSRRHLLQAGGSLSALVAFGALGGCERIKEQIANRPVRRRAGTAAAATDMAIYDDAVAQMKALPASNPRSWASQADIHLDFCPHGNWYFLPWHRAYLWFFEEICRELTGEPDFALPYWNWQADRAIPGPFWSGNLLHAPRSATATSMASSAYVGQSVMEDILALTNFEQFASYASTALSGSGGYGALEATPHNNIHGFVGGTMSSYSSPLDPVFWCHHNMIDCVWAHWNIERGNLNTNDPSWAGFDLTGMFVDASGNPASMTCGLTVILPLISYRFDVSAKGDDLPPLVVAINRDILERGGNIRHRVRLRAPLAESVTLALRQPMRIRVEESQAVLAAAADETQRVLLRAGAVMPPADDDTFVRVYVNAPDAGPDLGLDDPRYAGSFGFFTDPRHGGDHMQGQDFYVDVTDTLRRLRERGLLSPGEPVTLSLVATPYDTGERKPAAIRIRQLDFVTTAAAVRGE